MKKLKIASVAASEILSREELKRVFGGYGSEGAGRSGDQGYYVTWRDIGYSGSTNDYLIAYFKTEEEAIAFANYKSHISTVCDLTISKAIDEVVVNP